MNLGVGVLIFMVTLLIFWLLFAVFIKRLYGEEKVVCPSCHKKVNSLGTPKCPKCGSILFKDYYEDDYYKRNGRD